MGDEQNSSDWMITKLVELGKQKFGRRIRDNLESVDGKTLDDIMDASTKEAYMRLKPMSFTQRESLNDELDAWMNEVEAKKKSAILQKLTDAELNLERKDQEIKRLQEKLEKTEKDLDAVRREFCDVFAEARRLEKTLCEKDEELQRLKGNSAHIADGELAQSRRREMEKLLGAVRDQYNRLLGEHTVMHGVLLNQTREIRDLRDEGRIPPVEDEGQQHPDIKMENEDEIEFKVEVEEEEV